jgi:putative GTP pyrophosphokinase
MSQRGFGSIIHEYHNNQKLYDDFSTKVKGLVTQLLEEKQFNVHSVTSRTKDVRSLEKKIHGEGKDYQKLEEITDLSGIRIICYFSDEVDEIAKIITDNFYVLPELSIDKRKILDPDRFGYLSLHYIVELSDLRSNLPEYVRFKNLRCEIQIRSILQHAWAEIEHDLGYKSNIGIPKEIKRRFSRQAGLLELADEEFVKIRQDITQYSDKIKEQFPHSYDDILIDQVSLINYIKSSSVVKISDLKITYCARSTLTTENPSTSQMEQYLKILKFFNISTVSELDTKIKKYENKIAYYALFWNQNRLPSEKDRQILSEIEKYVKPEEIDTKFFYPGISIFYLGYLLAGQNGKIDYISNYLVDSGLASKIKNRDIVNEIIANFKAVSKLE